MNIQGLIKCLFFRLFFIINFFNEYNLQVPLLPVDLPTSKTQGCVSYVTITFNQFIYFLQSFNNKLNVF